jgi:hypothetical protein
MEQTQKAAYMISLELGVNLVTTIQGPCISKGLQILLLRFMFYYFP